MATHFFLLLEARKRRKKGRRGTREITMSVACLAALSRSVCVNDCPQREHHHVCSVKPRFDPAILISVQGRKSIFLRQVLCVSSIVQGMGPR